MSRNFQCHLAMDKECGGTRGGHQRIRFTQKGFQQGKWLNDVARVRRGTCSGKARKTFGVRSKKERERKALLGKNGRGLKSNP